MSDTESSRVEAFLADVSKRPQQRGNLIFALDATASRERTWDTAARLQVQMFREAAVIGSLDVQLVYFRGMNDFGGDAKLQPGSATPWCWQSLWPRSDAMPGKHRSARC